MKKIFKKLKLRDLIFFIIGGIVIGTVGITATTYVLKSSEIQYTNNKSVQQAIDELFVKAENCGKGSSETLPIGTIVSEGFKVIIPYTGSYPTIGCVYGTTEKYGSVGIINNNTCTFTGTSSNQQLHYKISALTTDGKIYEYSGSTTTGASGVTIVKDSLPTGVKAIVYLDPTNLGTVCNDSNSSVGGNAKSGCMKWYAYKEDDSSYTMILDHNTTAKVAWNSDNTNASMKDVQTELNNLVSTSRWQVIPRLIKGQEISNITGNTSWTPSSSGGIYSGGFYLDSNSEQPIAGTSKYYWLYDYTNSCTSFGCKVENSSTYGYWTSTPATDDTNQGDVWNVTRNGLLGIQTAGDTNRGVRPVITISKSSL